MSANDLRFARVVDSPSQRGRYKVTPSSKSTSPNSSPIHSTFPLSITSQFPQWEGHWSPIQTARDPRRVQSYSTLSMTEETAQSIPHPVSYDLTPRPGEFSAGTFDEMLSQSVYPLMPNRRLDLHLDHVKYQSDNSPWYVPAEFTNALMLTCLLARSLVRRPSRISAFRQPPQGVAATLALLRSLASRIYYITWDAHRRRPPQLLRRHPLRRHRHPHSGMQNSTQPGKTRFTSSLCFLPTTSSLSPSSTRASRTQTIVSNIRSRTR